MSSQAWVLGKRWGEVLINEVTLFEFEFRNWINIEETTLKFTESKYVPMNKQ